MAEGLTLRSGDQSLPDESAWNHPLKRLPELTRFRSPSFDSLNHSNSGWSTFVRFGGGMNESVDERKQKWTTLP
jgi:hypothetical protein